MKYVIIGASAAGVNGAENLRRLDKTAEIIMISEDSHIYSRCILHHYIGEIRNIKQLNFVSEDFFEKNNINWIKNKKVIMLDENNKILTLNDNSKITFDKLLISSGSSPFIPPIENLRGAENVVGLKTLEDCSAIIELGKKAKNIVVIGAGLIGMDAISGLLHNKEINANLSLIEMSNRLLPLQLDKMSSKIYEDKLIENKVNLHLNSKVLKANLNNKNLIESLTLEGDLTIPCDLIVVATGIKSNTDFLQNTKVEFDRKGLIFNEKGETNIKDIYGAGDVSGRGPIWSVAVKEGIIATSNMADVERVMDDFFVCKSTMNFFGIPTLSLGDQSLYENTEGIIIEISENENSYKKIAHKDGYIYGAIIQGDLEYTGVLTQLIRLDVDISKVKKSIFNIDYSDFFHLDTNCEFQY